MNRKKSTNYILTITSIVVVVALAYSINLVHTQQKLLNVSVDALDRIIAKVEILEAERNRLEIENIKLRQLEDKTTKEMEGLD